MSRISDTTPYHRPALATARDRSGPGPRLGPWWLWWWLLWSPLASPADFHVTLLPSAEQGIYLEVAQAIHQQVNQDGGNWRISQEDLHNYRADSSRELVIVLGVEALKRALADRTDTPILALLVPRLTFAALLAEHPGDGRRVSAIHLDQPPERQLQLLRLALPDHPRVGVLAGPYSRALADELERTARGGPLHLTIRRLTDQDDVFSALDEWATQIDVLLLLPDPLVVNSQTLPSLLLNTYRRRLPTMGYSSALVRAGALLGLYSTPAQIGAETWRWLQAFRRGRQFDPPASPTDFSIDINPHVAHSLGLKLPSSAHLERRMR